MSGSPTPKNSTIVRSKNPALEATKAGLRLLSPYAPTLASMWAERLFLTARRHERPSWEKGALASARRARVDYEGGWLPAWVWKPVGAPRSGAFDSRKTVLLVHGWEGRGSQLATFVEPLLAEGLRVVAFDAPGHGDAKVARASVVDHARAVAAVARQLGPIHGVIGHSVGGAAALLATRFGLEAERFALISPPRTPADFVQVFSKVLGLEAQVRDAMVARVEQRFGFRVADLDVEQDAARLYAPLLVVHDREDKVVLPANGRHLADIAPLGMFMETTGLGHRSILRAPEVVDTVARFVAAGSAPSFAETLDGELFLRDTRWRAA